MADLRRLGKRGSYRLGRLAPPPPAPARPPLAHYPSFARHHRGPVVAWLAAGLAAAAIVAAAALIGWWFVPLVAGLAVGLVARWGGLRLRVTLPAAAVIAAVGWGAALAAEELLGLRLTPVARQVAALAGLPGGAAGTYAAAAAVAAVQAVAGLWLGLALARLRRTDDE